MFRKYKQAMQARVWEHHVFDHYDGDRSGHLDHGELRNLSQGLLTPAQLASVNAAMPILAAAGTKPQDWRRFCREQNPAGALSEEVTDPFGASIFAMDHFEKFITAVEKILAKSEWKKTLVGKLKRTPGGAWELQHRRRI